MGDLSISQVSARPGRIGIRARQMFDGYRFQRGPVLVVVEDGRISAVDFAGSACPDMNLVDLGESTLLPGLVDAHAHLCWDPDGRPEDLAGDPHAVLVGRARRHAAAALRSGITTIRDLGDRDYAALALREEYRQKTTVGPELVVSGPPLTRSGGHCWFLGGVADSVEELVDAVQERALSTDAGVAPGRRHDVLPDDLVYLSRHGFTSTEVLTGATAAAAASCGLGHRKGRIAPGYDADLLAVAAGVDHDPAGLCDVKAVWRSGTQVPLQASAVGYNTPS